MMKPVNEVKALNTFSLETSIIGNVDSKGDIRLDGNMEGHLNCSGRVVIGPEGKVKGTISCDNADIFGKIEGDLIVMELLSLKSTAFINGNIKIGKFSVEPGAQFIGQCTMIPIEANKDELQNENH